MQSAVQRDGEGEGEVGIAAATCAQGNGFTPDAVPVVWVRVTVRVSPQRPAAASAPSCSLVALLQLGQEWLWLGRVGLGFESRRLSLYHIPPYSAPHASYRRDYYLHISTRIRQVLPKSVERDIPKVYNVTYKSVERDFLLE